MVLDGVSSNLSSSLLIKLISLFCYSRYFPYQSSCYVLSVSVSRSVKIDADEGFLRNGQSPVLTVLSAGHALHVFINGQLSGRQHLFSLLIFLYWAACSSLSLSSKLLKHWICLKFRKLKLGE